MYITCGAHKSLNALAFIPHPYLMLYTRVERLHHYIVYNVANKLKIFKTLFLSVKVGTTSVPTMYSVVFTWRFFYPNATSTGSKVEVQ